MFANAKICEVVSVLLIATFALLAFYKALFCFFLADDFSYLANLHLIASGRWDILLSAWKGNFLDVPVMSVYRPMMLMELLFDYWLWNSNSFGYHLSTIAYYICASALTFLWCRVLTENWHQVRSFTCSTVCALLFATQPLHAECVAWLAGRGDTICYTFCAATAWMFCTYLRRPKKITLVLAIISYSLALLTKEMAITWVLALLGCSIFISKERNSQKHLFFQIINSIRQVWWFVLCVIGYLLLRLSLLGSIGGYSGSFSEAQQSSAIYHWMHFDTLARLCLPLPLVLASKHHQLMDAAKLLACLTTGVAVAKLVCNDSWRDLRFLIFVGCLVSSALLPITGLWGLGPNWEGGRFLFFMSGSFALSFTLFLFRSPKQGSRRREDQLVCVTGTIACLIQVAINVYCANCVLDLWWHAGLQLQRLQVEAIKLAIKHPDKRLVLLGLPQTYYGVHQIYNDFTFRSMLRPPFTNSDYSKQFQTLLPVFYSRSQKINAQYLAEFCSNNKNALVLAWNGKTMNFSTAYVNLRTSNSQTDWEDYRTDETKRILEVDTTRLSKEYTFLVIRSRLTHPSSQANKALLYWNSSNTIDSIQEPAAFYVTNTQREQLTTFCVGDLWQWYAPSEILKINIYFQKPLPTHDVQIKLESDTLNRPRCHLTNCRTDESGVNYLTSETTVTVDASKIPLATGIVLQVSKPNYFFDGNIECAKNSCALQMSFDNTKITTELPADKIKNGFCQLRLYAIDKNKLKIGLYSFPITLFH